MNLSPGPVEASEVDDPNRRGLLRFHVALAGVFALFLAPVVSLWLALRQRKEAPGPWRRVLFGLAAIDIVVCACLAITVARPHEKAAAEHPRIGVTLNPKHPPNGVGIARVNPGSPAHQSDLRPGDVVERLDGAAVPDNDAFTTGIGASEAGVSHTLHIRRSGSELDVAVVPALGLKNASEPPAPLFEPIPVDQGDSWTNVLQGAMGYLPILVVLGIIGGFAWRRRVGILPLASVAGALLAYVAITVAVVFAFQKTVGLSLGAILVSMAAGGFTMLALGILQAREASNIEPRLGTIPAFLRGLFYAMAGSARVAIMIAALAPLLKIPDHAAAEVFGVSSGWSAGGIALFTLAAVVLAPAGEEYVFRGVLLPWLTTWMKPLTAIVVSSLAFGAGHLYYGAGVLIPTIYGLALGWVRLRTGSLRAGIALHMFFNASATLMLLLKG